VRKWLIRLLGGYTEPPTFTSVPVGTPEIKAIVELADSREIERLTDAVRDLADQQRKIARKYTNEPYFSTAYVDRRSFPGTIVNPQ
jgi:hypothetical protein